MNNDAISDTAIAEPLMHSDEKFEDVNYHVFIKKIASSEVRGTHCMRHMFTPEIKLMRKNEGFKLISTGEWMAGKEPGFDTR